MAGLRVLLLFGGRSGEHEVSVQSARLVTDALDRLGCVTVPVGITLDGRFVQADPREVDRRIGSGRPFVLPMQATADRGFDVAFPVLHGPYGEDGALQGVLEIADIPFVGAGVEGSAICLDKAVHKRLFRAEGLPVVGFVEVSRAEWETSRQELIDRCRGLRFPCFPKPAHLGSSVGISRVSHPEELVPAIERALRHDDVVLVEEFGGPRELEVGVLAGSPPEVSVAGEALPDADFYDYRSKYSEGGVELRIPAEIPASTYERMRELARAAFILSRCAGLARVDFFWDGRSDRLVLNEINSMPGMTPTSMFPLVWAQSGLSFAQVVERLLGDAMARHARRAALNRTRLESHDAEVGHRVAVPDV
jgi:D-alanine-D-alanine ligase